MDLLSAYNGAIPIRALRAKSLHNRQNKIVLTQIKQSSIVKGGESIVVEKIEDEKVPDVDLFQPAPAKKEEPVVEKIDERDDCSSKENEVKVVDTSTVKLVKLSDTEEVNGQKEKSKRKYTKRNPR